MKNKSESSTLIFIRSLAMGVLISMLFFYNIHVFGTWRIENYRPDPETTSSILLHNECLFFKKLHTLRPNTNVSNMSKEVDGTKLAGSFMNFFDGHITAMIIFALILGSFIFFLRNISRKKKLNSTI